MIQQQALYYNPLVYIYKQTKNGGYGDRSSHGNHSLRKS